MLAGTGREAALAGAQQANATNAAQKEKDAQRDKEGKSEK